MPEKISAVVHETVHGSPCVAELYDGPDGGCHRADFPPAALGEATAGEIRRRFREEGCRIGTEVLCALIAGAASVLAAKAEYRSRRSARRAEARAARREKESRLAMDLMYASCSLSLTTAKKLAGQHTNGDVEEAMAAAEAARTAYIGFIRSEAAHNVAKL